MKGINIIKNPTDNKTDDVLSAECAQAIFDVCSAEGILLDDSSVDLGLSGSEIQSILDSNISPQYKEEFTQRQNEVVQVILHSRYVNLYSLLKVSSMLFIRSSP